MAAKSNFEGEQRNALAAAERLSKRYGLSLEEAARAGLDGTLQKPKQKPSRPINVWSMGRHRAGRFAHLSETSLLAEKKRRDEAIRAAQARGLDADQRRPRQKSARVFAFSPKKRDPESHAEALISETAIPLGEIAAITGLNIFQIAGMKLKMRGRRSRA